MTIDEFLAIKSMMTASDDTWDNQEFDNEGDYLFDKFYDSSTNTLRETKERLTVYDLLKMTEVQQKILTDISFETYAQYHESNSEEPTTDEVEDSFIDEENYDLYNGGKTVHDQDFLMIIKALQLVSGVYNDQEKLTPNFATNFVKPALRMIMYYFKKDARNESKSN